jgi:hypothetical protein
MLVIHAAEDWITSPPIPSRFREAWQAIGIYSLVKIFACSEISLRVREEYFSRWYAIALLEGKLSN